MKKKGDAFGAIYNDYSGKKEKKGKKNKKERVFIVIAKRRSSSSDKQETGKKKKGKSRGAISGGPRRLCRVTMKKRKKGR